MTKEKEESVKLHYHKGTYRSIPTNNGNYKVQEERNRLIRKLEQVIPRLNQMNVSQWLWSKYGVYSAASCYIIITYRGKIEKLA